MQTGEFQSGIGSAVDILNASQSVPTDLVGNLRWRSALLKRCRDPKYQQAVLWLCERDILFWINSFVWTLDPRKAGQKVSPFICWDYQEEALLSQDPSNPGLLWCIETGHSMLIEKSRDMGASWLCLLVAAWQFLFHPWIKVLCISRSEDAVDKAGDPDCLFWKIDFALENLPHWMLRGWERSSTSCRQKMVFSHPLTKSTITGQASTDKAGVGGRATWMLIDEFSQIREAREILRRTAGTTDCRIFSGTHKGVGSVFYELANPLSAAGAFIKKRVMHWTQHPMKKKGMYRWDQKHNRPSIIDKTYRFPPDYPFVNELKPAGGPFPHIRSPWYDKKVKEIGDEGGVAEDLDINPSGSLDQVFDAVKIKLIAQESARVPLWVGEIETTPDGRPMGLRQARDGRLRLWRYPDGDQFAPSRFVVACDVSEGVGATPSCATIADAKTGEKIGEYCTAQMLPVDFARSVVALCRLLGDDEGREGAYLGWERAGPGNTFGKAVQEEYLYRFVFRPADDDKKARKKHAVEPGFLPTPEAKDNMFRLYAQALYSRHYTNPSKKALEECLGFERDNQGHAVHPNVKTRDEWSGATQCHGDRVIADALSWKLIRVLGMVRAKAESGKKEAPVNSFIWRRDKRKRKVDQNGRW